MSLVIILPTLLSSSCTNTSNSTITPVQAFEGVCSYCHSAYDWTIAQDNPSIISLEMGEETDSAYQVIFRRYTGALVYFYVNKTTGTTSIEEYVPRRQCTSHTL